MTFQRNEPMDGIHEDVADFLGSHPERFVPHLMGGRMIDAEHRARYWWAASFVEEKNVLDAGCGTGYGSNILAGAGAASVIGVDRAAHVIEYARTQAEPVASFQVGDLVALPFADDAFEVAVCFEAIEHVDVPEAVLDELVRVLRPGGLLAISSPNRDIYTGSNPHHRHEFAPEELRSALSARFRQVRLQRQQDWFATAIFDDDDLAIPPGEPLANGSSRKITSPEPGEETYTLALASDGPLPPPVPVVVLARDFDVRRLVDEAERARVALEKARGELRAMKSARSVKYVLALRSAYRDLLTRAAKVRDAVGSGKSHP